MPSVTRKELANFFELFEILMAYPEGLPAKQALEA